MRTLHVHKAQRMREDSTPVPDLTIVADEEFPKLDGHPLTDHADLHDQNGKAIADVLQQHLPGGTVDAVLRHLLLARALLLSVRL